MRLRYCSGGQILAVLSLVEAPWVASPELPFSIKLRVPVPALKLPRNEVDVFRHPFPLIAQIQGLLVEPGIPSRGFGLFEPLAGGTREVFYAAYRFVKRRSEVICAFGA